MDIFDILAYDHITVNDIDIITTDPDFTDVISLTTRDLEPGTYLLSFSLQFSMASVSQSFIYRFSMDGGATWGPEYPKEVKDRSNIEVIEVFRTIEHPGGVISIATQATREGGTAATKVVEAFLSAERKK
jgi:hypothetical protein